MKRSARVALALAVLPWSAAPPARADGPDLELGVAFKSAAMVSRSPDAPDLFPERDVAASLWRLRFAPELKLGERATVTAAYEQRLRVASQDMSFAPGVVPPEAGAPFRVTQLDWEIGSGAMYAWRHEIDRLAVSAPIGRVELTAGRQVVGWGRGVLFSAVDLFAPFSPLEVDREWRRGVDALRAEVPLTDAISADAIAALGSTLDESAFAGRVRGYRGAADLELVAGWRARDWMAGLTSSAAIGDTEVHGEIAAFRAADPLPAGGQLGSRGAIKAVLGGSYRLALGNGVPVFVEYHYSGFGAVRAGEVVALLGDSRFRTRFERGDTQILGRHALSLHATYDVATELTIGLRWVQSPRDGSGVVASTATATLSDRLAVVAALYVPWGAKPLGETLQSEYGSVSLTGFVQLVATY